MNNVATLASDLRDQDPADNSALATTLVGALADLAVTKTGPASITAGTAATWTITVHNNGPSAATSVVVRDGLPSGLTKVNVSASGATCSAGQCVFDSVASGATVTMTVTGTVPATFTAKTLVNSASAQSATADPDPTNNRDSVTSTVVHPATPPTTTPPTTNPTQPTVPPTTPYVAPRPPSRLSHTGADVQPWVLAGLGLLLGGAGLLRLSRRHRGGGHSQP